jgi:hypothetical protein
MKKNCILLFFILIINPLIAQRGKIDSISKKSGDEMVNTPAGPAPRSKVHFVDREHYLNIKDDRIQLVRKKTGEVSREFDNTLAKNPEEVRSNLNGKTLASDSSGWVTYTYWNNKSNIPITYFSTDWIVPLPPIYSDNQTVFLFNGLEETLHSPGNNYIIQPVLQWGVSAAGGGNYWAIADWYVSSSGTFFYDSLIEESPGTILHGVMKLTSDSSNIFNYKSYFTVDSSGFTLPGTALQVNNLAQAKWAFETLEVYGITDCSDYPPDIKVKMSRINIKMDSVDTALTWTPLNVAMECGQHSKIISNSSDSGEVDLYFHADTATSITNMSSVNEVRVYPDPATDNLTIESPQQAIIEIFNIQGWQIKSFEAIDNKTSIDVSEFPSGLYILEIKTEKGITVTKFAKE